METPDLSIYFAPASVKEPSGDTVASVKLGQATDIYRNDFPNWTAANIAIIGVCEDRGSEPNKGCASGPDEVRRFLYDLYPPAGNGLKICDLGNILPGERIEDTYFAVRTVVAQLLRRNIIPLILGGSQDLTYAMFSAYEQLEQTINVLGVDRVFDLAQEQNEFHSEAYLNRIILHEPNYLFNYSNIGYQTYFVCDTQLQLMEKLYFDTYRLGAFKNNIQAAEPVVRNADLMSFDISAVRQSDAPGSAHSGPNGFYGEDACQICRYAGMSDKLTAAGFFEFNPAFDRAGQTAHLLAQMVWCFLEGFLARKNDFPFREEEKYKRYQVIIQEFEHELVFYKSRVSDRWWLSVPFPSNQKLRFERHHLVPCSYEDYQMACADEVPDLWWKTFQKIT